MRPSILFASATLLLGATQSACAQDPLAVGAVAPPFALTGATRDGILPAKVQLADLRDKTVVIAFFYQAKTKG